MNSSTSIIVWNSPPFTSLDWPVRSKTSHQGSWVQGQVPIITSTPLQLEPHRIGRSVMLFLRMTKDGLKLVVFFRKWCGPSFLQYFPPKVHPWLPLTITTIIIITISTIKVDWSLVTPMQKYFRLWNEYHNFWRVNAVECRITCNSVHFMYRIHIHVYMYMSILHIHVYMYIYMYICSRTCIHVHVFLVTCTCTFSTLVVLVVFSKLVVFSTLM